MTNYYVYLIASLPALTFGAKPPLSFDKLLSSCEALIPPEDLALVSNLRSLDFSRVNIKNRTLREWIAFEIMLRNELVKIRASRRKMDPARYLREDGCPDSVYAAHIAMNACRKPSPLEAEKDLDMERWRHLENLSLGRYFDLDILIIYACKLLILEKWNMIQAADNHTLLEGALN